MPGGSIWGLEPPYFEELTAWASHSLDLDFEDAVKTDTARTTRWQELRPLSQYLNSSLAIFSLAPEACQYYLPAYLYAMTDPEVVWIYLSPILDTLWYEDDEGTLLYNNSHMRDRWEALTHLLTDQQRRCIAHWLVQVLRRINDPSVKVSTEEDWERERIENMLEKYWNAWL